MSGGHAGGPAHLQDSGQAEGCVGDCSNRSKSLCTNYVTKLRLFVLGIFDLFEGRLDVYVSNPATSDPIYSCSFKPKSVLHDWDLVKAQNS